MCVPSFFPYEQSNVLEQCPSAEPPAATLQKAWLFFFNSLSFTQESMQQMLLECFPALWLPFKLHIKEFPDKSSNILCFWQKTIWISTLDGKKCILTISMLLLAVVPHACRQSRGFSPGWGAGAESCLLAQEAGEAFPKVPRNSATCTQASLLLWKPYYLQFWIELN